MEKTNEEKIDYIYETLKKQENRYMKSLWAKWIFRVFMLGYFYYFIMFSLPNIINSFKESLSPNINTENISEGVKGLIDRFNF